jgi:P27 family predicted phage terminase small subunit
MKGRPPKPALVKELEGNPGHQPLHMDVETKGKPIMPNYLNDEEKMLWRSIERALPRGLLGQADSQAVERMAVAWATFRECCRKITGNNLTTVGSTGQLTVSPFLKIRSMAAMEMHKAGEVLGLSPVARARITQPDNPGDDPLALLLSGGALAGGARSKAN